MVIAAMKLKDVYSLEESYEKPRQHIKKQRLYYQQSLVKAMIFPVVIYECQSDYKEN